MSEPRASYSQEDDRRIVEEVTGQKLGSLDPPLDQYTQLLKWSLDDIGGRWNEDIGDLANLCLRAAEDRYEEITLNRIDTEVDHEYSPWVVKVWRFVIRWQPPPKVSRQDVLKQMAEELDDLSAKMQVASASQHSNAHNQDFRLYLYKPGVLAKFLRSEIRRMDSEIGE